MQCLIFLKLLFFLKRKKKRVREIEKTKQNRIRKENLDETNRLVSFAGWVLFGILFLFKSLELSETLLSNRQTTNLGSCGNSLISNSHAKAARKPRRLENHVSFPPQTHPVSFKPTCVHLRKRLRLLSGQD